MSMNKARDIHIQALPRGRYPSVSVFHREYPPNPSEHKTNVLRNCMQALWLGRTAREDTYNESVWKHVPRCVTGRNREEEEMRDEDIHKLPSLQNIIRVSKSRSMVSTRHAASIEEKWNTTEITEYPRPLCRTRSRWLVSIKINLK